MQKKMSWMIMIALVSVALTPVATRGQNAVDEESIKKSVEQLFMVFSKKDLNGVMACWSEKSPESAEFKRYAQANFAVSGDIQFENAAFARWNIEANQATVRVRVGKKWLDLRVKQAVQQVTVWDVRLVKEPEGWKWWQRRDAISDLAGKLETARTKEERAQLLQDEKELITPELVGTLNRASDRQGRQGNFADAFRLSNLSLEVAEVLGNKVELARCYRNRGVLLYYQSKYQEALDVLQRALTLFQTGKDMRGEAATLNNIGNVYRSTGRYEEALAQYEVSLKIDRDTGDRAGEAATLGNIGITYRLTGKYDEALTQYEAILKVMRETGDRAGEAKTLGNIGNIYGSTGKYDEALAQYEASLKIMKDIGDKVGEVSSLTGIGIMYWSTGRYDEALAQFEASLKIDRDMGNRAGEAASLGNIGNVYNSSGRYGEAMARFEAALKIMQEIGDKDGEARSLLGIGEIYRATGRHEEAMAQFEAALKTMQEIGNSAGEAEALKGIGVIYESTGKHEEAMARFDASLKIMQETGDRAGEAAVLASIGNIYGLTGRYEEALAQYEASLKIMQKIGDKPVEAIILDNIGNAYRLTGRHEEALAQYKKALKVAESVGDLDSALRSYWHTGLIYRARRQWRQAIDAFRKSIERIELTRAQAEEPFLQISFFQQYTSPYYGLIECLLELGSGGDEAFAVSEQAKARTLVDLMAGGKINLLKSVSDQDRQKERELNARVIAATAEFNNAQSRSEPDRRLDMLKQQRDQARTRYDEFRRNLFLRYPGLRTKQAKSDPATLTQLNRALFAREPNLCLLSYVVGDDDTLLFVITGGKDADAPPNLTIHALKTDDGRKLTHEELNRKLGAFRLRITRESGIYKPLARELYRMLLGPAEKELMNKKHVVIIPDGVLNTLPFQALLDGQDKHFIEKHTTSYAPSITALIEMTKLADQRRGENTSSLTMFAMGRRTFADHPEYRNRKLPRAEEQVISIARLFGVRPLTEMAATETKAKSEMSKARYVHFATHGDLNEFAPMYSSIVLGRSADDDGILYARELVDMDLQAEMVVLSGCETGLGQQMSGEGLLGLTWALFVAGTPSSVVTQWEVREDSMNILMVEFYRQLRSKGSRGQQAISKTEALQKGQLYLMKKNKYSHPYHWAPAVLVGDWR